MVDTLTTMEANHSNHERETLRKQMRAARRALSVEQLADAAAALQPKVLDTLHTFENQSPLKRVAGYLAFQGEIDVSPIMDSLRGKGIETYVPMLDGETLQFARWSEHTPYNKNRFGIIEPDVPREHWVSADKLDAILVPLVAFDSQGNRMGMGGGFYDKTFSARREKNGPPWLIGVAHELQRTNNVFEDWWDVRPDIIVSS